VAKSHLSELIKNASSGSAQKITVRGKPAVVVLSAQQYEKLVQRFTCRLRAAPLFLLNCPLNSHIIIDINASMDSAQEKWANKYQELNNNNKLSY
jgi:prevent-host-death family protein